MSLHKSFGFLSVLLWVLGIACTGPNDALPTDETDETGETGTTVIQCGDGTDVSCQSLFAARIYEQQCAVDPQHRGGCSDPLTDDIGVMNTAGDPLEEPIKKCTRTISL